MKPKSVRKYYIIVALVLAGQSCDLSFLFPAHGEGPLIPGGPSVVADSDAYLADFKKYLADYGYLIQQEVDSGYSGTYYYTSYYLHGMALAADATGDEDIMGQLVGYIEGMLGKATMVKHIDSDINSGPDDEDRNGDIWYPEWINDNPNDADQKGLDPNGRPWQLYTFQGTTALAHAAAVIERHPNLKATFGEQQARIVDFVRDSIFGYWFDVHKGVYDDPTHRYLGGRIPGISVALGGDGADTWGNRWGQVGMMVAVMHGAGIEFTSEEVRALAVTFLRNIWNRSMIDPRFYNYIDGENQDYGSKKAYENGVIYTG